MKATDIVGVVNATNRIHFTQTSKPITIGVLCGVGATAFIMALAVYNFPVTT